MNNFVVSNFESDITHLMIDNKVKHVVYKTIGVINPTVEPAPANFLMVNHSSRKIMGGEFDGYYEGKLVTYEFIKYLD